MYACIGHLDILTVNFLWTMHNGADQPMSSMGGSERPIKFIMNSWRLVFRRSGESGKWNLLISEISSTCNIYSPPHWQFSIHRHTQVNMTHEIRTFEWKHTYKRANVLQRRRTSLYFYFIFWVIYVTLAYVDAFTSLSFSFMSCCVACLPRVMA